MDHDPDLFSYSLSTLNGNVLDKYRSKNCEILFFKANFSVLLRFTYLFSENEPLFISQLL